MGFLEDLRRQNEEARREKERSEEMRQRMQEDGEKKWAEAIKYMNQSDFPRLAKELKSIVVGMKIEDIRPIVHPFEENERKSIFGIIGIKKKPEYVEGVEMRLEWGRVSGYDYPYVEVIAYCNGAIEVYGNARTRLSFQDWNGNSAIQEKALGSAFRSPLIYKAYTGGGG